MLTTSKSVRPSSSVRPCTLSSAAVAIGDLNSAIQTSHPRGNGCSISSTRASTRAGIRASRRSGVKPWFPSTPSQTSGRTARTIRTRSASRAGSSPVSFSFRALACPNPRAPCAIRSGASALRVKVVIFEAGSPTPASIHTGQPARCASNSHRAQSTALRAPPGGISSRRASRSIPASIWLRAPSIAEIIVSAFSLK